MMIYEILPAGFFQGRVCLQSSKETGRLLCRSRLQASSLLEEIPARLRKLAIIFKQEKTQIAGLARQLLQLCSWSELLNIMHTNKICHSVAQYL